MVFVRKFSEFPAGTLDEAVGLEAGANTRGPSGGGGGGSVTEIIDQDTTGLAAGEWVRFDDATQLYVPAISTSEEEAEVLGVVLNIIVNAVAGQFTLQQSGYIPLGTPGFAGFFTTGVYFLSDSVLGGQTLTEPTTNGYISKPVFEADSTDSGWVICLHRGVVIGAPAPIPSGGGTSTDTNIHDVSQPGNTFMVADWVYVSGDTTYSLTDATTLLSSQSVGVVISSGDPIFTVQFSGFNSNTITGAVDAVGAPLAIVSGTTYYLSDVVPGAICPTLPPLGFYSKPVFTSESHTGGTGYVLPQRVLQNVGEIDPSIVVVTQNLHGFSRGDAVRVSAANTYALAQSNNFGNSLAVGFVIRVIDVNTFVLQTAGYCAEFGAPFTPLVPSAQYYLSDAAAGDITTVEPVAITSYSRPMLIAVNTTTGYILEEKSTLVGGGGGGGSVIQLVSNIVTANSTQAVWPLTWTPVTNYTATITLSNAANRVKIDFNFTWMAGGGTFPILFRLTRNGVVIAGSLSAHANGATLSLRTNGIDIATSHILYDDAPAGLGPFVYGLEVYDASGIGVTIYKNYSSTIPSFSGISTFILEEIG